AAAALGVAAPDGSSHRRRGAVAVAALAVFAAAAAVAVAFLMRGGGQASPAEVGGALVRIDPATAQVSSRSVVPGYPGAVAIAGDSVWVADFRSDALWSFTPRTGTLTPIVTSGEPRDLAFLDGKVYVASDGPNTFTGTVARYDAATGHREAG